MSVVAAFYRFAPLADPAALRPPLVDLCARHGLRGSILLAPEGVNGTVAGPREGIEAALAHMRGWPGCRDLGRSESHAPEMPFGRLKIRLKREIVTMGEPVDPRAGSGIRVAPAEWNALATAPDVALIDTRNAYEVALGSFPGAIDPDTSRFGAFPDWWRAERGAFDGKRIAMFCTGGIRCEKSTAFLRAEGVGEVYHLDGGILNYLRQMPPDRSLWRGECFVFDGRVSVGPGLAPGRAILCHACRRPLRPADCERPDYEAGVRCHHCADEHREAARDRFRERQRQMNLARARGGAHLGPDACRTPVTSAV